MSAGGSLPTVDLLYVRRVMPAHQRLAERYWLARKTFIAARLAGEPSDALRRKAEALRDELRAKDPATA